MPAKRLLLFDIDGTLVNTGGAGVESLKTTVRNRFRAGDDLRDIEIAGKTDRAIIRDILRKYGVDPTEEKSFRSPANTSMVFHSGFPGHAGGSFLEFRNCSSAWRRNRTLCLRS